MITTKYTEIYENDMRRYFESLPVDVSALEAMAVAEMDKAPSPYEEKAAVYKIIADNCRPRLFAGYPLYFELESGRHRYDWGLRSQLGGLMQRRHVGEWYAHAGGYGDMIKPYIDRHIFHGWSPVGLDHHALNYEKIITKGYEGIKADILAQLEKYGPGDGFLRAALIGCDAVMKIADNFSKAAAELAETEQNEAFAADYRAIADMAARVPAKPCATFREALNTVIFSREIIGTFECYGISTLGHLDRILGPYYKADIESGRITRDEARRLLHALLAYTELRFDKDNGVHETSTTIYIGGCEKDGTPIYNDLTKLILEVYAEGHYFGTKLIARTSSQHPSEYALLLGRFISGGFNTLVIQNDDVLLDAHIRQGKALEDARQYVGGGCHEIVLGGCEVHSRADSWVNLPAILLETMKKRTYEDFAEFYVEVIADIRSIHNELSAAKNKFERNWHKYNPAPMMSAAIDDCIKKRMDITKGGARYNSVSLSMSGAATLIDSIWAVKEAVFGEDAVTSYDELVKAIDADFEGYEELRAKLLAYPKLGGANRLDERFADKVLRDLSACAGQPNTRGGHFVPAFYPHSIYMIFGRNMGATPDGRKAGQVTSRGISPSEWTEAAVTDMVGTLGGIDFARFDDSFVCDLNMPLGDADEKIIAAVILSFIKQGGSSLQVNVLDAQKLIEAKENPGMHRDIVVRVCGYSERFCCLDPKIQDEVIERAMRR